MVKSFMSLVSTATLFSKASSTSEIQALACSAASRVLALAALVILTASQAYLVDSTEAARSAAADTSSLRAAPRTLRAISMSRRAAVTASSDVDRARSFTLARAQDLVRLHRCSF